RQYSLELKSFVLTLNYYSSKIYNYIRTKFALPHPFRATSVHSAHIEKNYCEQYCERDTTDFARQKVYPRLREKCYEDDKYEQGHWWKVSVIKDNYYWAKNRR
ncbi:hypothetical protein ALC53_06663, partial [Atta colombica]